MRRIKDFCVVLTALLLLTTCGGGISSVVPPETSPVPVAPPETSPVVVPQDSAYYYGNFTGKLIDNFQEIVGDLFIPYR